MKKAYTLIHLSIITLTILLGCKSTLQTERPRESYKPQQSTITASEIPLNININIKKLELALNQKLNGVIYEGKNLANQDLQLKISKQDNFTFTVKNNIIEYRIPLKIWSRLAWKVDRFGISISDNYEANGAIALNYRTTLSVNKNWKLISKTESIGYQWIETPQVNIAGINLPIKTIADITLKNTNTEINKQIDKALTELIDINAYITQAWQTMQQPIEISTDHQLWAQVYPKEIFLAPFTSKHNILNLHLTLHAQIESTLGTKPNQATPKPLPELKIVNRPPQQINLNLLTDITFEKITQFSRELLKGQTFNINEKKIIIRDLDIFGSDGKLYFEASLDGSIKGKIYFSGIPTYNSEKNTIEIANPEFDINTKNVLIKSASWILHSLLLKQIQPYLTYPLTNELDEACRKTNQTIETLKIRQGIILKGKLNTINVQKLTIVTGAIRIETNATGNIALLIEDIEF